MNNQEGKRPYGIKEGSMPDPDNNSINRQPIIINLRKGKGHMTDNMTQGTVLERLLYHCKTWNNHKNNIMKREKEFKEYLKDKRIDLTSCIRTYTDYDLRITEVLDALEELGMSYQASLNVVDGKVEGLVIQISNWGKDTETIDYDTFVEKYREYDKEYELEHYIKDENGNMVHVELVCVKAEKDMVMTWKDTETGKIFQTKE
jgi:hypothetical protein